MKVYVVITTYCCYDNEFPIVGCRVFESESVAKKSAQYLNNIGAGVIAEVREEYVIPSQDSF